MSRSHWYRLVTVIRANSVLWRQGLDLISIAANLVWEFNGVFLLDQTVGLNVAIVWIASDA